MLTTKINGIKLHAITSTLPCDSIELNGKLIYQTSFHQTTSDLGFDAANRIIEQLQIDKNEIGFVLFGSKTPDYRSPVTSAILQGRLELSVDCICYDINVGINAFSQLVQIGSAVLKNTNKSLGLLIFGDTPSKFKKNQSENIFEESDAATAVLLEKSNEGNEILFISKSIGDFSNNWILKNGGFRSFNPSEPFDASVQSNFVAHLNEEMIKKAFNGLDKDAISNFISNSTALYHSSYLKYVPNDLLNHFNDRVLADASELPILLASMPLNLFDSDKYLSFLSVGEGLCFYAMKINHLPILLNTENSAQIFSDFRVSHEI
jgi:3-oxoacyl-[acyl-carrier-protein] synthase III